MPCPLLIFSQSDYYIQIVAINVHTMANSADPDQSQLIWIYTVCKGRVYSGSGGQGLKNAPGRGRSQIRVSCRSLRLGLYSAFSWLYILVLKCTFLMTDSICHSSLPRTVFEKVTLTTIQFRIHPRTKVDPMFQCMYISTPLKSCPYKSSATCAWSMVRIAEKTRLNICADQRLCCSL